MAPWNDQDGGIRKRSKRVQFSVATIYEFPVGLNRGAVSSTAGPVLGLDSRCPPVETTTLSLCPTQCRSKRKYRDAREMWISPYDRMRRLRDAGYSFNEIAESCVEGNLIRAEREETQVELEEEKILARWEETCAKRPVIDLLASCPGSTVDSPKVVGPACRVSEVNEEYAVDVVECSDPIVLPSLASSPSEKEKSGLSVCIPLYAESLLAAERFPDDNLEKKKGLLGIAAIAAVVYPYSVATSSLMEKLRHLIVFKYTRDMWVRYGPVILRIVQDFLMWLKSHESSSDSVYFPKCQDDVHLLVSQQQRELYL